MDENHGLHRHGREVVAVPEDVLVPPVRESDRVRVVGHRGSPAPGCPENSVAAVTEALRQGADGVEVDVRLTADDTLVCAHDPVVLTRTGTRRDVAASVSGDLLGVAGRNSLATLAEVLAAAQQHVGSEVVVEAKPVTDVTVAARTAHALADVLGATAGGAEVTVSSFDPALLAVIRRICVDLPVRTALLGDTWTRTAAVVWRAHEDGHDQVHLPLVGVRRAPQAVGTARWLGLPVTLWTVDRPRDLRWAADLGVDAVITDDVPGARRELHRAAPGEPAGAVPAAAAS
ncbi:glycerophosphodiester phosphodiesterase [Geodermatophilus sp. URMC 65]